MALSEMNTDYLSIYARGLLQRESGASLSERQSCLSGVHQVQHQSVIQSIISTGSHAQHVESC